MKLVYKKMDHIISFEEGFVSELVIENRNLFYDFVHNLCTQIEGAAGDLTLSLEDKPVEFVRHADVTLQFAPFQLNKKSLLTKLCTTLEQRAMEPENYQKTALLLSEIDNFIQDMASEFPFDVCCSKLSVGPLLKGLGLEFAEDDKTDLEKIFDYMELVRELDKDRLFVMVNMRTYFPDKDLQSFINSAV